MDQSFNVVSRRQCLLAVPAVAGVVAGFSFAELALAGSGALGVPNAFPLQDAAVASEMVGVSHARIERVRELLAIAPQFANATRDSGFGDWETAIGAASHVGNREIAALLLANGARPDLFTFAMLGNLDAVRAAITSQPGIERLRGPHGLTLMHHARAGGEGAVSVVEYLSTLPGSDVPYPEAPLTDAARDAVIGQYTWGEGGDQRLRVFVPEKKSRLAIARGNGAPLNMFHLGENTFHPAGAPDVRIRFTLEGGRAKRLSITTPAPLLEATVTTV